MDELKSTWKNMEKRLNSMKKKRRMELRNQKSKETIRKEHEWLNKLILKKCKT